MSGLPGLWKWRTRARDERGYVIVLVLVVIAIALAAGFAALASTLSLRQSANRELRVKRALQAADAGLQTALYRWNELNLSTINFTSGELQNLGNLLDCVIPTVNAQGKLTFNAVSIGASATVSSACPDPSGSGLGNAVANTNRIGNHSFFYIQYVPGATASGPGIALNPKIVATGVDDGGNTSTCSSSLTATSSQTSGCVVQRVMAVLGPVDPFQMIEATGNLSIGASALVGVVATGDVRTNGSVTVRGLSYTGTALLSTPPGAFANVVYGTTKSMPVLTVAHVEQKANAVNRSPITISPSKPDCADSSGNPVACATVLGSAYTAATHSLSLSTGTLTIPAGDYVFCNVNVTGGTLQANPSATGPVRIYVDSPTSGRCGSDGLGGGQGNFTDTPGFGLLSSVGSLVNQVGLLAGSSQLQIYMASSGTAQIGSSNPLSLTSLTESMFLYAPTATVNIGTTAFDGNIIGHNVTVNATVLSQNLGLNNYSLYNGVGVFHPLQYSTCTPQWPPTGTATNGC
jgi:Tfp pilus assembly protein PilX